MPSRRPQSISLLIFGCRGVSLILNDKNDTGRTGVEERDYLAMVAKVQDRRWPADLPRAPRYPFGEILLTEHLARWAAIQPDKAAINFYGATTSFAELHAKSDAFARHLQSLGIAKGDRVAVFLSNCPQFLIVFYGILKLGAVHVPVNPMFKAPELLYELNDTGATVIVALDQLYETVAEVLPKTSVKHVIVTSLIEAGPPRPASPPQPRSRCRSGYPPAPST